MSVYIECPLCNRRQSLKNSTCTKCAADLKKLQKSTRASNRNRVRYHIYYRDSAGKQRMEVAGYSLADARALDLERKREAREAKEDGLAPLDRGITFERLASWYLGQKSVQALASFKSGIIGIRLSQFNEKFGKTRVAAIRAGDLKNFQAELAEAGQSAGSIDQIVGKARAMVRAAWEDDLIGPEPVKAFKVAGKVLVPGSDVRETVLTREQFDSLMVHLPDHLRGIVACAFLCGMRKGEILGLTWDRVDLRGRSFRLEGRHTKSGQPRRIPMPDELVPILLKQSSRLRSAQDPEAPVFTFRGSAVTDIRTGLALACKKAGLSYGRRGRQGFVFHDLRHSFVTHARRAGVQESVIMKIVGHSSRAMLDRYNLVDDCDLEAATRQISAHFQPTTEAAAK